MPNGKLGDAPVTDFLSHGRKRFTAEIEDLLLRVDSYGDLGWGIVDELDLKYGPGKWFTDLANGATILPFPRPWLIKRFKARLEEVLEMAGERNRGE